VQAAKLAELVNCSVLARQGHPALSRGIALEQAQVGRVREVRQAVARRSREKAGDAVKGKLGAEDSEHLLTDAFLGAFAGRGFPGNDRRDYSGRRRRAVRSRKPRAVPARAQVPGSGMAVASPSIRNM